MSNPLDPHAAIVTEAAGQDVVAVTTEQRVVATATGERIVAHACGDGVGGLNLLGLVDLGA